ncbi:hypothetical protein AEA09_06120 [Lysinibacillus contaminans]|uniref:Uncharacterized protein n=1 Tax=Lysinibacillus contaminans TaxID=1293441 RepID=A0ABR5K0A6_9BACI|nr:hypothetical protein [Lysinibacillus contaminans]KOS68169.1 hypothetical protein AEA09_06120 [Lysinibacillus contaminans]
MDYIEYKKKKQNSFAFVLSYMGLTLITFLYAFIFCLVIHIRNHGEYFTSILWTTFVFLMPAVISILFTLLIYYYIFKKYYVSKSTFIALKEISGYFSVFSIIIINALVKFYVPNAEENSNKSFIIKELEGFFKITLADINYTYTLPILFSISTITMYIFEKWNHAYSSVRVVVKKVNNVKLLDSPTLQRCDAIVKEMKEILEESREILNKYKIR